MDITPSVSAGAPLAGFGNTPRREFNAKTIPLNFFAMAGVCLDLTPSDAATFFEPATGKQDSIMARALVLDNGQRKVAIVKIDTIGSSRKLREDLVNTAATFGIASDDFVLVATHTHSGPGAVSQQTLWQLAAADCYAGSVYRSILAGAESALSQANQALQPAMLGIGTTTETGASKNRRGRPGIYDTEIGLVKITTKGGKPIAALFNFAVHGTSYGDDNMRFSADCMGAMERVVEAGQPGAVAIFTNGAEGDVAPLHRGDAGVAKEGKIIGDAVLSLWNQVSTKGWVELRGAFLDVKMPPPTYNACALCMPLPDTAATDMGMPAKSTVCDLIPGLPLTLPLNPTWLSTTLPFQAIRIDDTVFVAIPGEPITEIGWDIKTRAKAKGFVRGFVLALANDHAGYFTTKAEYDRCKYEGQATLYGPTTGQVVVTSADSVMNQVK